MDFNWIRHDLLRGAGHSTSAAGKRSVHTVVVTSTMRQGELLNRLHGVKTASLQQGANGFFRGRPVPVVFDTEAVQTIVASYEAELDKLRKQLGVT